MKILVTGASGQVGRMLVRSARAQDHEVTPLYRTDPSLGATDGARVGDITDADAMNRLVGALGPDWIVHAAAITNADVCERDPDLALAVNSEATRVLAVAASQVGAKILYVSTDYVFDGSRGNYRESDSANPIQVYGLSKYEGERAVLNATPDAHVIARTSVVYGPSSSNFAMWLLRELRAGRQVRIVEDQRVSPTYLSNLSDQLLGLISADVRGIYHTAGSTQLSRYEFAIAIAREFSLSEHLITPIKCDELDWLAKRPLDSTLDVRRASRIVKADPLDVALKTFRRDLPN